MFYARILFACSYPFILIELVMKEVIVQEIFTNPMKSVSPTTIFTLTNPLRPEGIARRSFRNFQRPVLVNHDCCCLSIPCFTSECYLQFLPANKIRKLLQEYGILPHSRTYYCLLFSLYHMFIVFVISY